MIVAISAQEVKSLREKTGVGMMECKRALTEVEGDEEKAIKLLREKGMAKAAKRSARITREGMVHAYIHQGSKLGVLVEVNCETDFVALTDEFKGFVKDVAMHVAASNPLYIRREEVPEETVEAEKEIYANEARNTGKPEKVIGRIVEGKIKDYFSKICLLEQPFIKETGKTIEDLLQEQISRTGENISIRRVTLYRLGEE